jgi:hypothetical protein
VQSDEAEKRLQELRRRFVQHIGGYAANPAMASEATPSIALQCFGSCHDDGLLSQNYW